MISVDEALAALFALARVVPAQTVPLAEAAGRVLAQDMHATRNQPPFAASAMDGYALRGAEAHPGARFTVIGESAAGHSFGAPCGPGQAVRIFTGAPLPPGTDRVVIQEDVTRDGDHITLGAALDPGPYVRPQGDDFAQGAVLAAPRVIGPADVALMAAMNLPQVPVRRRPVVALLSTGDELVPPGETPGPDQIIASNTYGLQAMLAAAGAQVRMLPIVPDDLAALRFALSLAEGADLVVTIGGASVGDHDLVAQAVGQMGLERAFYKVRMRPGKPLMAGRLGDAVMVGLPGNPVSAMVCGQVFVLPLLRAMQGLPQAPAPRLRLPLARGIGANGPREHYARARRSPGGVVVLPRQDSALLSVLAEADCLAVLPPHAPAMAAGDMIEVVPLG